MCTQEHVLEQWLYDQTLFVVVRSLLVLLYYIIYIYIYYFLDISMPLLESMLLS